MINALSNFIFGSKKESLNPNAISAGVPYDFALARLNVNILTTHRTLDNKALHISYWRKHNTLLTVMSVKHMAYFGFKVNKTAMSAKFIINT